MVKVLASVIVGLCLFLSNISSQAKAFQIVGHIISEHSTSKKQDSHHHHGHHHHQKKSAHKKNTKHGNHHHESDLSLTSVQLHISSIKAFLFLATLSFKYSQNFHSTKALTPLSFSSSIFRPPIV